MDQRELALAKKTNIDSRYLGLAWTIADQDGLPCISVVVDQYGLEQIGVDQYGLAWTSIIVDQNGESRMSVDQDGLACI